MAQLKNTTINDTGTLDLPSGTTAQRPSSPIQGMIRFNTTIGDTEYYDGGLWRPISDSNPEATGGTIVDTDIGGVPYRIHIFKNTGNSNFTVTKGGEVEYLIVAGGGGGGGWGGGGGAGGVLTGNINSTPQTYTVVVGTGGAKGTNAYSGGGSGGSSSVFSLTAAGGGGGGWYNANTGASGGSGGGGGGGESNTTAFVSVAGAGTAGQGNAGGRGRGRPSSIYWGGGGGGGAGSPGEDAPIGGRGGNGGNGLVSSITGVSTFYGGGGGGNTPGQEAATSTAFALGGLGGGGNGGRYSYFTAKNADDGLPNTGGGGGSAQGGSVPNTTIGTGGSGIVIIRYRRNVSTATNPNSVLTSFLPYNYARDVRPIIVRDGLVLELDAANPLSYPGSGTTWSDLSGNGNNGSFVNNVGYTNQNFGVLTFDGVNTRVNTTQSLSNSFGNGEASVSMWIKTFEQTSRNCLLYARGNSTSLGTGGGSDGGSGRNINIQHRGAAIRVALAGRSGGGTSTYVGPNVPINEFVFFTVQWSQSQSIVSFFLNGVLEVSSSATALNLSPFSNSNTSITTIGNNGGDQPHNGLIGLVQVYNRALSPQEIQQNFNATRGRYGI